MSAQPRLLLWLDLETTGLSPRESDILEMAYVVTEFPYPYERVCQGSYLVSGEGRLELLQGHCSELIQDMHDKSGLRAALATEPVHTIPSIESEMLRLADAQGWPSASEKDGKVVIAGSSVGTFDLQFLRARMPRLAARLSHRAFDVSAVRLAARSLGMPESVSSEQPAHRAAEDVEASLSLMRRAVAWLRSPV